METWAAGVVKRTFIFSFLAGVVVMVAVAALFPLPRHERFPSEIEVLNNGGRGEDFQIRWPQDRLGLDLAPAQTELGKTPGMVVLSGSTAGPAVAELFRLRDVQGNVIGIASRLTASMPGRRGGARSVSNWTLSIPISLFVTS